MLKSRVCASNSIYLEVLKKKKIWCNIFNEGFYTNLLEKHKKKKKKKKKIQKAYIL